MPHPDYVSYFIEKSKEPGFEFSSMRKELEAANVPKARIKIIISTVDNEIIKRASDSNQSSPVNRRIILGLIMIGVTVVLAVASYLTSTTSVFYVLPAPAIVGFFQLFTGITNAHKDDHGMPRFRDRWRKR